MKKENVFGIVVYLIILGLAVVFGLVVLKEYFNVAGAHAMESWQFALFILGAVLSGSIFNASMFELAHILGAKIGGYRIISVCILGLKFYKENDKVKLSITPYDGLTGETKISPRKNLKKEANPTAYLLFGTLFYAVEIVGAIILFAYLTSRESKENVQWGFFALTASIVGAMILLYNIIPLKLDSMNDGYRLRLASGAKNRKAFNNLLRMENGETPIDEDESIKNTSFSSDININRLYELLLNRDFTSAEKLIDEDILANEKISKNVYLRARAQKIYIHIMSHSLEETKKFYDEEVELKERRAISEDISIDCIRAYVLMSGLLDRSRSECLIALKKIYRAYKSVPEQRKDLERELYNEALTKVIEAHPTWELDGYLMKKPQ